MHTLLQNKYPDLYSSIFPVSLSGDTIARNSDNSLTSSVSQPNHQLDRSSDSLPPPKLSNVEPEQNQCGSHCSTVSVSVELAQRLFECVNVLYSHQTARLRSEVRELSHRIRGLQTNHESACRDWQRVERERDQLRRELSSQIARYEDRLTELHSVIAELRRRLEQAGTNAIPEADEFEEQDELIDDEDANASLPDPHRIRHKLDSNTDQLVSRSRDHESISQVDDVHSDRSSEGGTSVGAINGDLLDTCTFHTRPDRFGNQLDLSSSAGDLTHLSDVLCTCHETGPGKNIFRYGSTSAAIRGWVNDNRHPRRSSRDGGDENSNTEAAADYADINK
ncbi:unnamed protein product [Echinostoma caproni]|uniref:Uncharacterized protein n=1 Tax=Echinostoma caproni TaxID=27848 RepID=A0A3P8GAD9_9TREM|nr:unnamed protein product [Echinostoma caproni]